MESNETISEPVLHTEIPSSVNRKPGGSVGAPHPGEVTAIGIHTETLSDFVCLTIVRNIL